MSILSENSKKMLVESMRECLSDVLHESTSLTSKQATDKIKYVNESATYEQLLNITMNPHREEKYLPSYVLEGAVAILHSACMTGRKIIGPNAITEGALKLQKKTGAVITESMMDAALAAATEGCGLKVVGKILNEAFDEKLQWKWLSDQITDPAAKREVEAEIAAIRAHTQTGLSTRAKGILASVPGLGNADQIEKFLGNGQDPTMLRLTNIRNGLGTQVASLRSKALAGTISQKEAAQLTQLERRLQTITKSIENGGSSTIQKSLQKAANSNVGKTPWGKIALGAAAVGGAGALGWKYWQNRKAMQRDMANGTSPY